MREIINLTSGSTRRWYESAYWFREKRHREHMRKNWPRLYAFCMLEWAVLGFAGILCLLGALLSLIDWQSLCKL